MSELPINVSHESNIMSKIIRSLFCHSIYIVNSYLKLTWKNPLYLKIICTLGWKIQILFPNTCHWFLVAGIYDIQIKKI